MTADADWIDLDATTVLAAIRRSINKESTAMASDRERVLACLKSTSRGLYQIAAVCDIEVRRARTVVNTLVREGEVAQVGEVFSLVVKNNG